MLHCLLISAPLVALDLRLPSEYAARSMEYSDLAWYGEQLILLPQYPDAALPVIDKKSLETALDHPDTFLRVHDLPFDDHVIHETISGFEGYEAIVFDGESLYLLVEARTFFGSMRGYLVRCRIDDESITAEKFIELPLPTDISNFAFEALSLADDDLIVFYEANGIMPRPYAYRISRDLKDVSRIDLESIQYRLTATTPFVDNRAWAIQSYWNGEQKKLRVGERENFGRIIELERTASGIRTTPRFIPLHEGSVSYNWEGIVSFDKKGFIVVTDTHPKTVLWFVEWELSQ